MELHEMLDNKNRLLFISITKLIRSFYTLYRMKMIHMQAEDNAKQWVSCYVSCFLSTELGISSKNYVSQSSWEHFRFYAFFYFCKNKSQRLQTEHEIDPASYHESIWRIPGMTVYETLYVQRKERNQERQLEHRQRLNPNIWEKYSWYKTDGTILQKRDWMGNLAMEWENTWTMRSASSSRCTTSIFTYAYKFCDMNSWTQYTWPASLLQMFCYAAPVICFDEASINTSKPLNTLWVRLAPL